MMILFFIIAIAIASVYLLEKLLGISLLSDAIRYGFESCTKYRVPLTMYGFCNQSEMDDFAKELSAHFTAITAIYLTYDDMGWQYANFEIVLPASGIAPGLREAIAIEARNYIRQNHKIDNRCIIVPVLSDRFLCIQIACSKKANALFSELDFSSPRKYHGVIEEEVEPFHTSGK